jgi:hypothetical protein
MLAGRFERLTTVAAGLANADYGVLLKECLFVLTSPLGSTVSVRMSLAAASPVASLCRRESKQACLWSACGAMWRKVSSNALLLLINSRTCVA